MPILDILLIALIVIALSGLRVAQQYERGVVFRLGRYQGLRGPGLYWIIPLGVERSVRVDIRTRTVSAEQQETITRDSVTIKVITKSFTRPRSLYLNLPLPVLSSSKLLSNPRFIAISRFFKTRDN